MDSDTAGRVPVEIATFDVPDIVADAAHLTPVRRALLAWLLGVGVSDGRSHDITLAAYEAMANSVEHAYGTSDATVSTIGLRVSRHPGSGLVVVRVEDRGVWDTSDGGRQSRTDRPPGLPLRGRGLPLIYALADRVSIDSATGTTIDMQFDGT